MFIYYRLICFTLMKENLYWEKERFFFGIFRCISVLWITAACYSPLTFFAVQAGISIVLLSPSLVFIMMVCYFYIFQRFNLQLFLLLTLVLRFISYRCRCRRIWKKGSIFSVSFHFSVLFCCCKWKKSFTNWKSMFTL